ncbi:MAG: nucleotidyltransferase family protein [Holophaga sp.]
MRRNDAIRILRSALPVLRDKYGVKDLALFGSVARDEATSQSDVDILVTFNGPATFDGFLGLEETLESLLGGKVDLVTDKALKPLIRPSVERDLIHVA